MMSAPHPVQEEDFGVVEVHATPHQKAEYVRDMARSLSDMAPEAELKPLREALSVVVTKADAFLHGRA
ncbi:MAG: hypothetical protein AAGC95_15125 [Pseudomonadota bacterium]